MDGGQSAPTLSFGRKNGWFLSRNVAVALFVLFLGALLATGLLVYYYATPFGAGDATQTIATPVEASSTNFASAGIIGGRSPNTPVSRYIHVANNIFFVLLIVLEMFFSF